MGVFQNHWPEVTSLVFVLEVCYFNWGTAPRNVVSVPQETTMWKAALAANTRERRNGRRVVDCGGKEE